MENATAAAFLAAHAAPLPAAVDLKAIARALEALPPGRGPDALASNEVYFTFEAEEGRPLVTLQRPRMYGGDGLYTLALTDGRLIAAFDRCPSYRRVLEAVYSYARCDLPADCDAAEELESYLVSFGGNWATARDSDVVPPFRASALTRCARWARRIALARAADLAEEAAIMAPHVESGPVGPDWTPARPSESFYAQSIAPDGTPGAFAFGPTEEAAREALARKEGRAASLGVDPAERDTEGRAASLGVKAAEAGIRAARRMIDAPAGLGLAPVTPALESPLVPFAPGASRVALALARGVDPARLIRGDFGPRARAFVGGF